MRTWSVTARGLAGVQVQGRNWIVALGRGLDELGRAEDLARLACEVLPNGTVIARDIATGTGYIVQMVDAPAGSVRPESVPPSSVRRQVQTPPTADRTEETVEAPRPPPVDEEADAGTPFVLDGEVEDPLDDPTSDLAQEEADGEPIFELPADAISAIDDEPSHGAIDRAETPLMACMLAMQAALVDVPAESGAVILEERGYLRFTAVHGPASRKLMGVRLPMGTGVAGFAMEKRRTVVLSDAHEDPRHCGEVDALTGYVTREIAVVPIQNGGAVLGVLELMNLAGGGRFNESDIRKIQSVADSLAVRLGR